MNFRNLYKRVLVESDFAETAMAAGLDQFCELGGWDLGHFFMVGEGPRNEIVSGKHWYSRLDARSYELFEAETSRMRVIWGGDVPGRVMASGSAEWFPTPESLPAAQRMALGRRIGIKSAFAFPVQIGSELVAVIEVFSVKERPLDNELTEFAAVFAGHLGRLLERDRLSAELAKARQEAMDAAVAKSSFLAQVSHEIRTPLNAILGMTHLLSASPMDREQRDFTDSIRTSAYSLLRIVNDLLDISRIEAGKFEIQPGDFDLRSLIKDTVGMLSHLAQGKGISLSVHIDPSIPECLRGDAGRLRQVLLNLLGNAIKFTDQGQVCLRVLGEASSALSVKVRFEVEDTGIGIPESQHPKVFELFTQADPSAARKYGGTGLGLSISKRLIELMGGEIGFNSSEGVGSIFWVTLSLESATPANKTVIRSSQASVPAGRIALVVEDNEINLKVMTRMLESIGLKAAAAASGAEALRLFGERKFDLIFMDCQMPVMDGYDVTREIRKLGGTLPIIAVTANVIKGDRERCLAAGMNDYLSKPIEPDKLLARVKYWLKQSENRAEPQPQSRFRAELDQKALERIRGMNVEGQSDFLVELVGLFQETSPKRIGAMRSAIQSGDADGLSREAHYLKSSSANLGALELSALCQKLDEMGRRKSLDGASETLEALEIAYQNACGALNVHLQI